MKFGLLPLSGCCRGVCRLLLTLEDSEMIMLLGWMICEAQTGAEFDGTCGTDHKK